MINKILQNSITSNNVKIYMENDKLNFSINDTHYLTDDINYPKQFCHRMFDFNFNSILIGGLGLGLIPYYLENYKSISTIDVIEINQDVINTAIQLNHLKNTNILLGDVYSQIVKKKYDLILLDLWWLPEELNETNRMNLIHKYERNLTQTGKLYIPINDEIIF